MADLLTGLRDQAARLASWFSAGLAAPHGDDGTTAAAAAVTAAFPAAAPPSAAAAGWSPAAERSLLDTLRVPSFAAAQVRDITWWMT
jgi:hypothetical protein